MKFSISKTILLLLITVLAVVSSRSESFAQTAKRNKTPKDASYSIVENEVLTQKGGVNDFAEILDQRAAGKLEKILAKFKPNARIDFVIVTVKSTGEKSAFDYSLSLGNGWAVGAENPDKAGILMLIAIEDKRWHIQITRVLEEVMSDSEVGEIGALMRPFFREKKYGGGITTSVENLLRC